MNLPKGDSNQLHKGRNNKLCCAIWLAEITPPSMRMADKFW
jgi:hypothetical protein